MKSIRSFSFSKYSKAKGFTLIELLVVIAIIGILTSIAIISLNSSREKANRVSTIATLSSAMPELIVCADDGGFGVNVIPSSSLFVCATDATGASAFSNHLITWPSLTAGWVYQAPTGSFLGGDYTYTAIKPSQATITCTFVNSKCI